MCVRRGVLLKTRDHSQGGQAHLWWYDSFADGDCPPQERVSANRVPPPGDT